MKHWIYFATCISFVLSQGCSDSNASAHTDTDASTSTDSTSDTQTDSSSDNEDDSSPDNTSDNETDTGATIDTELFENADCAVAGDEQTTLLFVNQCDAPLTAEGSDIPPAELSAGASACRHLGSDVEAISSVRFWGYIGPNPGGEHHTLAEFTFNTDFYDFDWYNISHVDAHNRPMAILPLEMADCPSLVCPNELLSDCPDEGQFFIDGELVSCVSPDRDNPDSVVAQYFEEGCADAYSWSGDDAESMAACAGEDYAVVFCP